MYVGHTHEDVIAFIAIMARNLTKNEL